MIRLEYEFGGRRFTDPSHLGDALMASIFEEVGNGVSKQLRSVTCGEHAQRPTVRSKGRRSDEIDFELSGCCENFIQEAAAAIR